MGLQDTLRPIEIITTTSTNKEEGESRRAVSFDDSDESSSSNNYFDIIVLGLQEATFKMETIQKEMSNRDDLLPVLAPILRKVAKKTKKLSDKANTTLTQFTADKDHIKKISNSSSSPLSLSKLSLKQQQRQQSSSTTTEAEESVHSSSNNNKDKDNTLPSEPSCPPDSITGVMTESERTSSSLETTLATEDSAVLQELLQQRLPSYNFVVRYQRGEMRLEVLVRQGVDCRVVSVKAQNTGLINLGANKGGIVGELSCHGDTTRVSFVTAHLEAHEGQQKYKQRCHMMQQILEGTSDDSLAAVKYDVSQRSHFCFVLGDLNFRSDIPAYGSSGNSSGAKSPTTTSSNHKKEIPLSPPSSKKEPSKEEHHKAVMDLVESENWRELNRHDELFRGLKQKDLLVGFQTLPCFFPPTFKVERQAGFSYKQQRRPSYCDRVLWKTAQELENRIIPLAYEPIDNFTTSDHKPIRAAFEIQPNEKIRRRPSMQRRASMFDMFRKSVATTTAGPPIVRENLHLFVSHIKCSIDKRATAFDVDPSAYVAFVSSPKALIRQKRTGRQKLLKRFGLVSLGSSHKEDGRIDRTVQGWPRTRKLKETYTPDWGDEQIHVVVKTHGKDGEQLDHSGSLLHLTVIDHSPSIELSRVLGTCTLNLAHLCQSARTKGKTVQATRRASMMWNAKPSSSETFMLDIENQPLLKYGLQRGTISCTIDACWVDNAGHSSGKSLRAIKKKNVLRRVVSKRL